MTHPPRNAADELERLAAKLEAAERDTALKEEIIDSLWAELNVAANERDALQAKVEAREKPSAGWFDWLPQGTTHISEIRTVTIPSFGLEARFNAFKYVDGVLHTYRTDSDNEYGMWVKAASCYRNDVIPTVYPLYLAPGAQGEQK